MSTVIRDLWPDDIRSEEVVSPEAILKHQAERLETRTNGLLAARVVKLAGEDRVVLNFEVESPGAGRRVHLFAVQHRLDLEYPVAIIPPDDSLPNFLKERIYRPGLGETMASVTGLGQWVENRWVASSPETFANLVQEVLAQPAIKAVVLSLLSHANPEQATDETDDADLSGSETSP